MSGYEFQDHRPMAHHARSELLLHLREHLLWGKMHLDEYCYRYPDSGTNRAVHEIRDRIQQALVYLEFGDINAQPVDKGGKT